MDKLIKKYSGSVRIYGKTKSGRASRKCIGWEIYNDLKKDPAYKDIIHKLRVFDNCVEFEITK